MNLEMNALVTKCPIARLERDTCPLSDVVMKLFGKHFLGVVVKLFKNLDSVDTPFSLIFIRIFAQS